MALVLTLSMTMGLMAARMGVHNQARQPTHPTDVSPSGTFLAKKVTDRQSNPSPLLSSSLLSFSSAHLFIVPPLAPVMVFAHHFFRALSFHHLRSHHHRHHLLHLIVGLSLSIPPNPSSSSECILRELLFSLILVKFLKFFILY